MMGKTNTVYAETSETSELSLNIESILTNTSDEIWKIEYVNNVFFAFLGSGKVMYGTEISDLNFLKRDGENYTATHVIYFEDKYIFVNVNESGQNKELVIYTTQNLTDFNSDVIETFGKYDNIYVLGIFLSSKGKIITLIAEGTKIYLGSFDSIDEIKWSNLVQIGSISGASDINSKSIKMYKDRILGSYTVSSASAPSRFFMLSLDGYIESGMIYSFNIVGDELYAISSSYPNESIYYSNNGVDYSLVGETPKKVSFITLYDDKKIGIFCDNSGNFEFALAESRKDIIDSLDRMIDASDIIGKISCACTVGLYTYLGSSGGVIYKTFADYSGNNNAPNVTVLKSLSAKQALNDAKIYTDQKYAELEARIAALEAHSGEA